MHQFSTFCNKEKFRAILSITITKSIVQVFPLHVSMIYFVCRFLRLLHRFTWLSFVKPEETHWSFTMYVLKLFYFLLLLLFSDCFP
jgi:hypothetical protein